jgi:hypothetical protein
MARPSSVNLEQELHRQSRAAVRLVRRMTGRPYTMTQFFNEAVHGQLKVVADTFNEGRPVHPDDEPLEPGRSR